MTGMAPLPGEKPRVEALFYPEVIPRFKDTCVVMLSVDLGWLNVANLGFGTDLSYSFVKCDSYLMATPYP